MEPKGVLQCSQEPTTGPCPDPDATSLHLNALFPRDSFLLLSIA